MKSKLLLITFLFASALCFAQDVQFSGKVNEATTGMPMPGVNVVVKNSTASTVTDMDGNFSISAPAGSTLVFTFIGYETVEMAGSTAMTVNLEEDAQTLEEVVVIGYGTQRRREVTGAVSVVDDETLEDLKPVRLEQALQGTVSGVNVTSQSGAPGAGFDVRIRGVASNDNNKPLMLVDGIIANMSFSDLNFADVESITVLKDAQAAIYGTAGANGVILVTMKKGRKNSKTTFSYNNYVGFQETSKKLNLLNATEYALLLNESYANGGQAIPFPDVSGLGNGTDWQEEVFGDNVPIINHDISVSGGGEKTTYHLSYSDFEQGGIIGGNKSHFERSTATIGMTSELTERLKFSSNTNYMWQNRRSFNENVLGSVLFNAINTPPIYAPYDENGDFTVLPTGSADIPGSNLGNEIINPLAQIANTFNDYDLRRISTVVSLDYEPIDGLVVTARYGYNSQDSRSRVFNKQVSYGGKVFDNVRSSVNQNAINDNDFTFDLFANYKRSFAEAHNFSATLGTTVYKNWGEGLFATGFDVPNNSWENADIRLTTGFTDAKTADSYVYDERRVSYFGRLQYDFKGRYLISGMIRRDMSTKFGPDYRVAWFPSVTGGWIISDEPFYGTSEALSFIKLRASYGVLGSDLIGNNQYVGIFNGEATYIFDGQLVNGTAIGSLPNPKARWEEARKLDVGLDLRLWKDKIEVTADYFNDERAQLLITGIPITGTAGTGGPGGSYPTLNAGDVINRGFEFAINYNDNIGDFNFGINYTAAFIHNEVTRVDNGTGSFLAGNFGLNTQATIMRPGDPLGSFYGYKTDGIFQNQAEVDAHLPQNGIGAAAQPGDLRFVDVNGDGELNADDRTYIGDPIPDATMGINIHFEYKGFDFVGYGFASLGNDMLRNYERTLNDVNRLNYTLDRWHGEGTSNSTPRVTTGATANNVLSDYFVEDASYFRIQNVQLGYSLNDDITNTLGVTRLRLYVGVNNLYTFTKYRGFDPGASSGVPLSSGIDYGFYPIPRTYLFGLNLNF